MIKMKNESLLLVSLLSLFLCLLSFFLAFFLSLYLSLFLFFLSFFLLLFDDANRLTCLIFICSRRVSFREKERICASDFNFSFWWRIRFRETTGFTNKPKSNRWAVSFNNCFICFCFLVRFKFAHVLVFTQFAEKPTNFQSTKIKCHF